MRKILEQSLEFFTCSSHFYACKALPQVCLKGLLVLNLERLLRIGLLRNCWQFVQNIICSHGYQKHPCLKGNCLDILMTTFHYGILKLSDFLGMCIDLLLDVLWITVVSSLYFVDQRAKWLPTLDRNNGEWIRRSIY